MQWLSERTHYVVDKENALNEMLVSCAGIYPWHRHDERLFYGRGAVNAGLALEWALANFPSVTQYVPCGTTSKQIHSRSFKIVHSSSFKIVRFHAFTDKLQIVARRDNCQPFVRILAVETGVFSTSKANGGRGAAFWAGYLQVLQFQLHITLNLCYLFCRSSCLNEKFPHRRNIPVPRSA